MTGKIREKTVWLMKLLSLCLALALVLEMAPVHAETFDQKVAANGTKFQPLGPDEKTEFLLFGSHAKYADGMQGRWKMLTKAQVDSLKDNASAKAVFGDYSLSLWINGRSFSTALDGQTLQSEAASGIDIKFLADKYGIESDTKTKTKLTAIGKDDTSASTDSDMFETTRYYFSSLTAQGLRADPLLKVDKGSMSLRIGQKKATEMTHDKWKEEIKALQIDTITTATQRVDVVFTADKNEYTLSDIVDAGQYSAEYAYYNDANEAVTATVEGARLSDVLAKRSLRPVAGDTVYAVDDQGTKTQLNNDISTYLLAYKGTTQMEGAASSELTSNSEFCLFGPGTKEDEVRINNIYGVEIVKKATPTPTPVPVARPKATKILKLTKKNRTITVKWKKIGGINGYQISMATKKNGKYKTIKTVTKAGTVKYTKKKLKKGKKYYFKVRTYKTVSGVKYYSPWSAVKYKKL